MRLQGKTALVTGATGAIGEAITNKFLEEGANLVVVGRSRDKLDSLVSRLGAPTNLISVVAEATNEEAVNLSIQAAIEAFDSIDIVIANAGTEGRVQPLEAYTMEEFNHVLAVNVTGVWLYLKHAIPRMREKGAGSIVAISSGAGVVGFGGLCPYSASKHAVCGMVKTACIENGAAGIRINTLAPGPVDNKMMSSVESQINPTSPESVRDGVKNLIPMNRYAKNEEIANLALFLASDEASFCNGCVYLADGGFTSV